MPRYYRKHLCDYRGWKLLVKGWPSGSSHLLPFGWPRGKLTLVPYGWAMGKSKFVSDVKLPALSILMWPGTVATIPSGWVLCNGSNGTPNLHNKHIIGAGGSFAKGSTGGGETFSVSAASGGSHTGTTFTGGGGTLVGGANKGAVSNGAHAHSLTASLGLPLSNLTRFIMSLDRKRIPFGAVCLSLRPSPLKGQAVHSDSVGKFFLGKTDGSVGSVGAADRTLSGTWSSAGSHQHTTGAGQSGEGSGYYDVSSGAHAPAWSGTLDQQPRHCWALPVLIGSSQFSFDKMVCYYNGLLSDLLGPWTLASDLIDTFIRGTDQSSLIGSLDGSNDDYSLSTSTTHSASHTHQGSSTAATITTGAVYHTTNTWSHSHPVTATVKVVPPYHALYQIICDL